MWRALFHCVTLLLAALAMSQAMNMESYRRVLEISLHPRGDPVADENSKKAIIELVIAHLNMVVGVPYTMGSFTGLLQSGKRRKRFSGFGSFGSSFGSNWGGNNLDPWFDPWNNNNNRYNRPNTNTNSHHPSGGSSNSFNSRGGNYGGFNRQRDIIHCPVQANQSAVYQLNPSAIGYPAADIGNELFIRSLPGSDLFFQCLLRAAIIPGQPPIVAVDQSFVTANETCPSQNLTLFNYAYQNSVFGGRCWLVQGFQEVVQFSVCQTKSCENCQLKETKRQSGYQQFSSSHHHHPNSYNQRNTNITVNQCVADYRTVQVISYCENLPINQRIIYDRIIVPLFCSCKSIDCMKAPQW